MSWSRVTSKTYLLSKMPLNIKYPKHKNLFWGSGERLGLIFISCVSSCCLLRLLKTLVNAFLIITSLSPIVVWVCSEKMFCNTIFPSQILSPAQNKVCRGQLRKYSTTLIITLVFRLWSSSWWCETSLDQDHADVDCSHGQHSSPEAQHSTNNGLAVVRKYFRVNKQNIFNHNKQRCAAEHLR